MREWEIRELICEMGRRAWLRQFVAANEGNISVRISDDEVLTTPTMISKGFMQPEDICKVDMEGNTLEAAQGRKPTSEVVMHLNVYKERPDIRAVVHVHPPHATAFAIAGEPLPKCVLPEVEIFVGEIPIAQYASPGSVDLYKTLAPYVNQYTAFLLSNHGALTIGRDLTEAYFRMEIVDSYCRVLLLMKQIGTVRQIEPENMQHLFAIKEKMGLPDRRMGADPCEACSLETPPAGGGGSPVAESLLVRDVVEEVIKRLMKEQ